MNTFCSREKKEHGDFDSQLIFQFWLFLNRAKCKMNFFITGILFLLVPSFLSFFPSQLIFHKVN